MDARPNVPHLSSEFYMWLWWMSEVQGSQIVFADEGEVASIDTIGSCDLWVDSRMAFRDQANVRPTTILTGENPAITPEARAALVSGKAVQEIRLGIRVDEREYYVTLKDSPMMLKGTSVPSVVHDGDEELVFERMYLIEELDRILGILFNMFARQRTSPRWHLDILPKIQDWAGEEQGKT